MKLSPNQKEIVALLKSQPKRWDWTNKELSRALGWEINSVTGRVTELKELKVLIPTMPRRCTISGETATAFRLSGKA